ncbi:anhydro-N-acetylmuramic acid kinase [beta proteobacterium AAP121]|nr:anhydro-N-acetylmuramic acid kinase [beta proteobacterium AAP65]KPF93056.1 anhydro-N-acetylmuramic acid kinase [beta proteobacterium AAP121]
MAWFIGLMSGTSLDGVDAVLAETSASGPLQSRAHRHLPFPAALRAELLALNTSGANELHRAALAANALATVYAEAVQAVLSAQGLPAAAVTALGAHGQTVRHQPGLHDGTGYTLQLFNGARLAELTGIDVVCDFRSRDVAAGGQGAPLVPAFHAASFARPGKTQAVLNLGGIANVTLLHADGRVEGFDTGPANVLMDTWCQQQRGQAYDEGGRWAASGRVDEPLLAKALSDPYFSLAPPKSTGRELFDARWLHAWLAGAPKAAPADVMATLAALTARSAAQAVRMYAPETQALYVCGGGAANAHLMGLLQSALPGVAMASTAAAGVAPDQVEALAFAWLAQACLARQAGNVPAVTGARGPRVLGALYPA